MRNSIKIIGGDLLSGSVTIQGSKNAFHKVIGSCVRWPIVARLRGVPKIQDAEWLIEQFEYIGGIVTRSGSITTLDSRSISPRVIGVELAERSSGTFLFAGALLARFGEVEIAPPGGDKIGYRPVNYHLAAFEALGASVTKHGLNYRIVADSLVGAEFVFPGKTVNGTVNAVLAATGADSTVKLSGCAIESDIENSFDFMNQLGARIEIIDRKRGIVRVTPAEVKSKLDFNIIADRNATATYAIAAALVGRKITMENINTADTSPLWLFLEEAGSSVEIKEQSKTAVISLGERKAVSKVVEGRIPPEFSTDWGPMVQVLLTQLPGGSEYHEMVYSNRFAHVPELVKMGADAQLHDIDENDWVDPSSFSQEKSYDRCKFEGPTKLHGTTVTANDIRNGAALVLAGLVADGETIVRKAIHVQRGYEDMVKTLQNLGANVSWI